MQLDLNSIFDYYFSNGFSVIPLNKKTKIPYKSWRIKDYTISDLLKFKNCNFGYRIGQCDLVIDVDRRLGGMESFAQLCMFLGINLTEEYTAVKSGDNGLHIYTKLYKYEKFKKELSDYEGIQFKQYGTFVVIPGSVHPKTGKTYEFLNIKEQKIAPEQLLDLLRVKEVKREFVQSNDTIGNYELSQILKHIPVCDYDTNDKWFPILAASYHATGGTGLDAFLNWSLSDDRYKDDQQKIESRWNSLFSLNNSSCYTIGTLLYEKSKYQSYDVNETIKDFSVVEDDELSEIVEKIYKLDIVNGEPNDVSVILEEMTGLPYSKCIGLFDLIATVTSISGDTIKSAFQKIRHLSNIKNQPQDLASQIVLRTLKMFYNNGADLMHASNQIFYEYNGKYWTEVQDNILKQKLLSVISLLQPKDDTPFDTARALRNSLSVLSGQVATNQQPGNFNGASILNLKNGELHINNKNGDFELRKHNRNSMLTSVIDIAYSPDATCEMFDKYLHEVFGDNKVSSFLYEVIGYAMQTNKNIPIIINLKGVAGGGKSTFLSILQGLFGDAYVSSKIDYFAGNNTHASHTLFNKLILVDDDVSSTTVLPDGWLKSFSESKSILCNPKFKKPFNFTSNVTVFLASNTFLRSKDISDGMRRRFVIIPFKKKITNVDVDFAKKIIDNELPGILNKALSGLKKLRKRGCFEIPRACNLLMSEWLTGNSSLYDFMEQNYERSYSEERLKDMYLLYKEWCRDNNVKSKLTLSTFKMELEVLGYIIDKNPRTHAQVVLNVSRVYGDFEDY